MLETGPHQVPVLGGNNFEIPLPLLAPSRYVIRQLFIPLNLTHRFKIRATLASADDDLLL